MEIGAVIGAAPRVNVVRERPSAGDVIVLLGGRTGRDGIGGATGSSKEHTEESLTTSGAEAQKGNPPTERKIQCLFRNPNVSRMIKRCNFGERILMVENTVILGVLTGAVFSVVEWKAQLPYPWLAHVILGAYGTAAGIFVGCIAVALAEILNTFPILFRRLYINRGLSGVMIAMALGKMAGSFYYFFFGYGLPKYW